MRVKRSSIYRTISLWKSSSFGTASVNHLTRLEVEVNFVNKSTLAKLVRNWCLGLSTSHYIKFNNVTQYRDIKYFKFSKPPSNLKYFQYDSTWSTHVSAVRDYSTACFRNSTVYQKKRLKPKKMATGFQESNLSPGKWIYDEFQTSLIDDARRAQVTLVA